jgi:hypothetical protein
MMPPRVTFRSRTGDHGQQVGTQDSAGDEDEGARSWAPTGSSESGQGRGTHGTWSNYLLTVNSGSQ